MRQKYLNRENEVVEAEQVLAPTKPDMKPEEKESLEQTYSEKHGDLYIPHGYWKIWKDGKPRSSAPNDLLFKKHHKPFQEKAEEKAKV